MKVKTSDLTGAALDWAVAKAEYTDRRVELNPHGGVRVENGPGSGDSYGVGWFDFRASTDWAQGGPIIDREKLDLYHSTDKSNWASAIWSDIPGGGQLHHKQRGPTALIAAMRCFVASKLGDEVDVPEGLVL